MRLAVIGSRSLQLDISPYIPSCVSAIISGGARGVDKCAAEYAWKHGLKLIEFLPDYKRYGRGAPFRRNDLIIEASDMVLAFWDGESKGTRYQIERARKLGKPCEVVICKTTNS